MWHYLISVLHPLSIHPTLPWPITFSTVYHLHVVVLPHHRSLFHDKNKPHPHDVRCDSIHLNWSPSALSSYHKENFLRGLHVVSYMNFWRVLGNTCIFYINIIFHIHHQDCVNSSCTLDHLSKTNNMCILLFTIQMHITLLECIIEKRKYNHNNTYLLVNHVTSDLHTTLLPTIGNIPCSYTLQEAIPDFDISFLQQGKEHQLSFVTSLSRVLTTD